MRDLKKREKKAYEGVFYWDNDKENMWIKLAVPTADEIEEMRKACTEIIIDFIPNPAKGQNLERVETQKVDGEKLSDMILDKTLLEWGNFTLDGDDLACTLENKKLLISSVDGFLNFYRGASEMLLGDFAQKHGGTSELGNSKSTQSNG